MAGPVKQPSPLNYREAHRAWERAYLLRVLRRAHGNVSLAARLAGLDRASLYRMATRVSYRLPRIPDRAVA